MNQYTSCFLLSLFVLLAAGCSSKPPQDKITVNKAKTNLSNSGQVRNGIIDQYQLWKGAPYTYGGLSKDGVDCSGLVYAVYLEQFGVVVPRTTRGQSVIGKEIPRSQLRPGDLVFFKTGSKSRHVGIYLDQNQFLHASESKGVILSSLNNVYWRSKYWLARRVQ
ncbi:NlpC/P60 family protein [Vibrio sp.]|nr:NlpC/P60 family protein [Vibrio sp.]